MFSLSPVFSVHSQYYSFLFLLLLRFLSQFVIEFVYTTSANERVLYMCLICMCIGKFCYNGGHAIFTFVTINLVDYVLPLDVRVVSFAFTHHTLHITNAATVPIEAN